MELFVFDFNLNRLGIIDVYEKAEFEQHYEKDSHCFITVEGNPKHADLLLSEDVRVIVRSDDIHRGYIVNVAEYEDESKLKIAVVGISLGNMIGWRTIDGQQRFTGTIEDVIKGFVNLNCVNPVNPKRKIPNLVIGANTGITDVAEVVYTGKELDIAVWEMCKNYDMSFEVLIDHDNKKFVFSTYRGVNRSAEQSVNSHVIFAKAFDNVNKQNYTDDRSNYKTTAYIAGEGEGVNRKRVLIGDEYSGVNRRELYVDARDLQAKYSDENGQEIILNETQYLESLRNRGENKRAEYQRVRTFTSDIDLLSRFRYREHYWLGDKVTNRNDELGIVMHSRVVSAFETFERTGYDLKLEYGTSIPTLIDKIKREVRR